MITILKFNYLNLYYKYFSFILDLNFNLLFLLNNLFNINKKNKLKILINLNKNTSFNLNNINNLSTKLNLYLNINNDNKFLFEFPIIDNFGNLNLNGINKHIIFKNIYQYNIKYNKYQNNIYNITINYGIFNYNIFFIKNNIYIKLNNKIISLSDIFLYYKKLNILKYILYKNIYLKKLYLLHLLNLKKSINLNYIYQFIISNIYLYILLYDKLNRNKLKKNNYFQYFFILHLCYFINLIINYKYLGKVINLKDNYSNFKYITSDYNLIFSNILNKICVLNYNNIKTLNLKIKSLKESFCLNPLIQYSNNLNSLSTYMDKHKVIKSWPVKLRQNYASLNTRDLKLTNLFKVCLIDTSEGLQAGLVNYLLDDIYFNNVGEIMNYKILLKTNKIYLSKHNIENNLILLANYILKKKNILENNKFIGIKNNIINKYNMVNNQKYNFNNILSSRENLIPFIFYNDPTRCLLGTKMLTQATPLIYNELPLIYTSFEQFSFNDNLMYLKSYTEGIVIFVSNYKITIIDIYNREVNYYLQKYKKSNQNTLINQYPIVWPGERILIGQLLASNSDLINNEYSIGKNLFINYGNFNGFEYDDSIILNKKLLYKQIFTSVSLKIYETLYTLKNIKFPEYSSKFIPKKHYKDLKYLNKFGIIEEGSYITEKTILSSKIISQPILYNKFNNLNLLNILFGINIINIIDKSTLADSNSSGRVIKTEYFLNKKSLNNYYLKTRIYICNLNLIQVGDKLSGRHGNKGIISHFVEEADIPFSTLPFDIDILCSPIGIPSRLNIGQLFESLYGLNSAIYNKRYLINTNFSNSWSFDYIKLYLFNTLFNVTKGTLYKTSLNKYFYNKINLKDGFKGTNFIGSSIIGNSYFVKLIHMIKDKIQYRVTGPYNILTQQPIKGKEKKGGQRFGEMEVWALKAYGASYILKEMFTFKSDDLNSRNLIQLYLINNTKIYNSKLPEIFKLIFKELQGIYLNLNSFNLIDLNNLFNIKTKFN